MVRQEKFCLMHFLNVIMTLRSTIKKPQDDHLHKKYRPYMKLSSSSSLLLVSFYVLDSCRVDAHDCIFVSKKCFRVHVHTRTVSNSGTPSENPKISRSTRCGVQRRKTVEVARYIITSGSNVCRIDDYKSGEIKGLACSAS